jgi:hypothetical protein
MYRERKKKTRKQNLYQSILLPYRGEDDGYLMGLPQAFLLQFLSLKSKQIRPERVVCKLSNYVLLAGLNFYKCFTICRLTNAVSPGAALP